jgi:hypothetical protein
MMEASGECPFKESTHILYFVDNKHLAGEKTIQSINQMFSLPPAKHLGDGWDHFLFIREVGHSDPEVQSSMRTQNEDDGCLDTPRSPGWDIFQVCGSVQHRSSLRLVGLSLVS